jgi:hypothetical protein
MDDRTFFLILSALPLLSYFAGHLIARRTYLDYRADRGLLIDENKGLREEVYQLKGEALELKQRINGYEDEVNRLNLELGGSTREEDFTN